MIGNDIILKSNVLFDKNIMSLLIIFNIKIVIKRSSKTFIHQIKVLLFIPVSLHPELPLHFVVYLPHHRVLDPPHLTVLEFASAPRLLAEPHP